MSVKNWNWFDDSWRSYLVPALKQLGFTFNDLIPKEFAFSAAGPVAAVAAQTSYFYPEITTLALAASLVESSTPRQFVYFGEVAFNFEAEFSSGLGASTCSILSGLGLITPAAENNAHLGGITVDNFTPTNVQLRSMENPVVKTAALFSHLSLTVSGADLS